MKEPSPNYISLHSHSIGSLRDGIMKVSDHVNFALKNNKKFVCITDHGSISEWIELYTQCNKNDLTPIFGIEGYVHVDRDNYLENKEGGKPNHVTLLALNEVGFKNIVKIHNDAWRHFYKSPIMSYPYIFEHNEGIVMTSGCLGGTLPQLLTKKQIAEADEFVKTIKSHFEDRYFIELMFIDYEEQKEGNRQLAQFAKKHNIPTIINTDSHYLTAEDAHAHQLSLLLQSDKTLKDLEEGKGWKFSAQDLFMKTEDELLKHWEKTYRNDPIITRDLVIESTYNVDMITSRVEKIYLEHPPRLPKYKNGKRALTDIVINGFEDKLNKGYIPADQIDKYTERVQYELKTIEELELIDYFLLINDIIKFCRDNDIAAGPGRGSVSASLVTYMMGITKLDPIKYNFIFERFLNPARKTRMKIL